MHTYKKILPFITSILLATVIEPVQANTAEVNQVAADEIKKELVEFPGRKKFAQIPYISIEQLHQEYDDVVIVDARTPLEYKVIRVSSAVNVPLNLSDDEFTDKLHVLRKNNPSKKIVFYCNGHTCMKSYKATKRALKTAKIGNVFAYDAGVFDWARSYPNKATLLDQTPVNADTLLSKSKLKKHMLPALQFINQADDNVIILDVRDRFRREGFSIFSGYEEAISMDNYRDLDKYINLAKAENKALYIYDEVGKQVRWIQYRLENKNAGPYYFMEGGTLAFFKIPNDMLMDK